MAANIDFERIPGKKGDPYRGQAVHHTEETEWDRQHKIKLPPIPDFRFEAAYLSALKPFVQWQENESARQTPGKKEQVAEGGAKVSSVRFDYGAPLQINWPAVLWVTFRDQVFVQFATGCLYATWALFGTPFLRSVRVGLTSFFTFPKISSSANKQR